MRFIRKTLFWIHLVVGLTIGLEIAMLAGTGMLMAFQHPIVDRAERVIAPPPPGVKPTDKQQAWPITSLLSTAAAAMPDTTPSSLTAYPDLTRPATVQFGRERTLQLNNFTGKIVGNGAPRLRAFFATVESLHRWLALSGTGREWGRYIAHYACLGFLFLILSGLYLWFPKRLRWQALRPILVPNLRLRGKARDWNWHNVIGFWLAIPLLVITTTGTVMAFPWANRLLYLAVGEAPPMERGERPASTMPSRRGDGDRRSDFKTQPQQLNLDGLDDLWDLAESTAAPGWASMSIQLSARGGRGSATRGGVAFVFVYGTAELPYDRVTYTFNRRSGDLISTEKFADQSRGHQLRSLIVPIHRGEILGLPGMAIAAIACLGALLLVYTGFALSWRRLVRPILMRRRSPAIEKTKVLEYA